jgi:MFS family permease
MAEGGALDWGAVYVRTSLHGSVWLGGIATSLTALAISVGRFVGDRLNDRIGQMALLVWSGVVITVGFILAVAFPSAWISIGGFCLAGLGLSNVVPILFKLAGTQPGVSASAGLAAVTTCGYAGFLCGPPIVGYLADWKSLGFSVGSLSFFGLAISLFAPRTSEK